MINTVLWTSYRISHQLPEYLRCEVAQASRIDSADSIRAVHDYRNLSIEEVVVSRCSIIRVLGMLDRRVRTRRLQRFDESHEPALVKAHYVFRCLAEGLEPRVTDDLRDLLAELRRRRARARHLRTPEIQQEQDEKSRSANAALRKPRGRQLLALIAQVRPMGSCYVADPEEVPRGEAARIVHGVYQVTADCDALTGLLVRVGKVTDLLDDATSQRGVCAMARHAEHWRRSIATWKPRSKKREEAVRFARTPSVRELPCARFYGPSVEDRW